jgi:sugar/nucleoside kinase (ribokinase family)
MKPTISEVLLPSYLQTNVLSYRQIIGIGGIGSGMLFHCHSNETIGRSESRLAELTPAKDYCKLQIVFYYLAALLTPQVQIHPAGFVGRDSFGLSLTEQMLLQGMDVELIGYSDTLPTMLSVCWQYPDRDGGNITASNSACSLVTEDFVKNSLSPLIDSKTIVAALPEVSIPARIALLREGKKKSAFCVLSLAEAEAEDFWNANVFSSCDLLAVNEGEARALTQSGLCGQELAETLSCRLGKINPFLSIVMTCGKDGAFSIQNGQVEQIPPLLAHVKNTTGAGDALLGGTIAGLCFGLPFQKGKNDRYYGETTLHSAVELGTLCAGMATESEDSIALSVTKETLRSRIQ